MADLSTLSREQLIRRKELLQKKQQILLKQQAQQPSKIGLGTFLKPETGISLPLELRIPFQTLPESFRSEAVRHLKPRTEPTIQKIPATTQVGTVPRPPIAASPIGGLTGIGIQKVAEKVRPRDIARFVLERVLLDPRTFLPGGAKPAEEAVELAGRATQQVRKGVQGIGIPFRGLLRRGARLKRRVASERLPVPQQIKKAIDKTKETARLASDEVTKVIKQNINDFSARLQKVSEAGAVKFQKTLPKFFRRNSQAYGQRLDDISESLIQTGGGIKRGRLKQVIDETLFEQQDLLLPEGSALKKINQIRDKYVEGSFEDILNFKEVIADIRSVGKVLKLKVQEGGARFGSEDVIGAIFKKNFGKYVAEVVPEFKKLQSAYSPVIESMKQAQKTFKPFAGEFQTKTATGFLKRAGLGKLERGERTLLTKVEKGGEFAKGVGAVSKQSKQIGKKLLKEKAKLKEVKGAATKQIEKRVAKLTTRKEKAEGLIRKQRGVEKLAREKSQKVRAGLAVGGGITSGIFLLRELARILREGE